MTSGERSTMAPNWKSQKAGLSIAFIGTPASRAACLKRPASASSSVSSSTIAAPARSAGVQTRSCSVRRGARARSSRISWQGSAA